MLYLHKKMGGLAKVWYFLLFVLITILFFYGNVMDKSYGEDAFNLDNYLKNPQKYGDYKGQVFGKITGINQDSFYINSLKVSGSGIIKPVYGETVLFLDFKKDGIIKLIDYHNYNYNYFLYVISFFAFVVFIVIFFKEWKITLRGFKDA